VKHPAFPAKFGDSSQSPSSFSVVFILYFCTTYGEKTPKISPCETFLSFFDLFLEKSTGAETTDTASAGSCLPLNFTPRVFPARPTRSARRTAGAHAKRYAPTASVGTEGAAN
jgi:hypothetical protein